ncbi:MAG: PEP-utilizing enzyme [Myxococcales bacterium]|nr:PEP-utilizing enzyme [Myxococcales bacterium]MDD9971898.1 PEP-utilizing enzyme [Myxococcales bacterium]
MTALQFSTKGRTLERLRPVIQSATVLDSVVFVAKDYRADASLILETVRGRFEGQALIVRSSAGREDTATCSNAGAFTTVGNVNGADPRAVAEAIDAVIASYGPLDERDEVLVQPMLRDIDICGVVLSADLDTLAPYYIINYDETGTTDGITGGSTEESRTYVHFKDAEFPHPDARVAKLIAVCAECEKRFGCTALDIEFAVTKAGEVCVLQVRPIATKPMGGAVPANLNATLSKVHRKVEKQMAPHPYLLGRRTLFGVMPDWNPAEIIGTRPRALALSLYKELVTDGIWAYQRHNYGYRDLRSHPLLVSFLGVPYVDVRVSFNSFVPETLDERIAERLVNFYLDKLATTPTQHDKVEFGIVFSCYHPGLPDALRELEAHGFNANEIKRIEFALMNVTNGIISANGGHFRRDLDRIRQLDSRRRTIVASDFGLIEKIYWLIEDCKRYGTLPFAGIARSAFVAVQLLHSFVEMGHMTQQQYDAFLRSLNTVSQRLARDADQLALGNMSREEFLDTYGHLRPGTYDILSPSYDEDFERYFSSTRSVKQRTDETFAFSETQVARMGDALVENGIESDFDGLIAFIKESIEAREQSKFIFTRSLSQILKLVGELGAKHQVTREELSHLNIHRIMELYATLDHRDVEHALRADIEHNRQFYAYTQALRLPNMIVHPNDVYSFLLDPHEPNFVTHKRIEAETVREEQFGELGVQHRIALIQSADPGYDYLFAKNIAGLVTQYGGANSHMAIRCAELGIPAVIGAGEQNFNEWQKAEVIGIDCANKVVWVAR